MKILAQLIRRELKLEAGKWGHCAIYEDQLQRLWPIDEVNRKQKIAQFALLTESLMNTSLSTLRFLVAAALLFLAAQRLSLAGSATWDQNPLSGD